MSFDDSVKERIREATDIVQLVEQYIPLKPSGRNHVGRCPWHDDSRPSLQVNPVRQSYKCWVCDIGGDVFSFVMKIENVDFKEAMEILADKAGITIPKKTKRIFLPADPGSVDPNPDGPAGREQKEISKQALLKAAQWLAEQYHQALLTHPEAEPARKYLEERDIDRKDVEKFLVGYAPMETDWLVNKVKRNPTRLQILALVGNLKPERRNEDFFRGRLIFPIRDEQARTVAFGGRLIPGSPLAEDDWHKGRKYLNSSETVLFSKHKILYGLDAARTRMKETRRAIVVEGFTDCVTAHKFGFGDSVAVLGTALGPAHIRILQRYAEKIILMLDGDEAGRSKSERNEVLTDFIAQGADMAVLTLPDGMDPAEFLEKYGPGALETLLKTETVDALEHAFRAKTRGIDLKNDIIGASKALDSLLEIIAHAPVRENAPDDPVRFRIEKTIQNLATRFLVTETQIRQRLREKRRKIASRPQYVSDHNNETPPMEDDEIWSNPEFLPDDLEREMLELWLADPTTVYEFWESVPVERCRSPVTRMIYAKCNELIDRLSKRNTLVTFGHLITAFDDPKMKSFLVKLDDSSRSKREIRTPPLIGDGTPELPKNTYHDDLNGLKELVREETEEHQPLPAELRQRLVREILDGFDRRDEVRGRIDTVNKLRGDSLTDEEKTEKLLQLQKTLREKQEEKRRRIDN